jgi:uncharacterized membrane protein
MEQSIAGAEAPTERKLNPFNVVAAALLTIGAALFLWKAPGSYEVYKALHVTFAVIWVGGGVGLTIIGLLALRENDPKDIPVIVKYAEQLGMKVFTPSGLIVVAMGVVLTQKADWGWGTFWIDFALAVWALSFVIGAGVLGPTAKKMHQAFEASGGETTAEIAALQNRIVSIARIDSVLLLLIVIDMTAKPAF